MGGKVYEDVKSCWFYFIFMAGLAGREVVEGNGDEKERGWWRNS